MTVPGKLTVGSDGKLRGPAKIQYNNPFPTRNGRYGSGAMSGVLMHTMVTDLPTCIKIFNDPAKQASAHFGIAQDGTIYQFGPIGKGWIAWHAGAANNAWYGIEHADHGDPNNPLTSQQITASAQVVECLASYAGFPLAVTNSVSGRGYGTHSMGGAAWGGHTCPDMPPRHVRSAQRQAIIDLAKQIHTGAAPAPRPSGGTTVAGPQFGIDASSYQGNVNWAVVDATTAFGFEKVTEGTGYTNPYWSNAKGALAARAKASGFVPGAYLFLAQGNGAGQADYFARQAGNIDGFAIAVDVEPSSTRPDIGTARACFARLRQIYPGRPLIGYIPHWYWGSQDTTFCDVLWASNYVTGTGSPSALYSKVSASQWAAYGGRPVTLLQFTSSASVPGVGGTCDCSAFRGTVAELQAALLGKKAAPAPPPAAPAPPPQPELEDQQMPQGIQLPSVVGETISLSWPNGSYAGMTIVTDDKGPVTFSVKELHTKPESRWLVKDDIQVTTRTVRDFGSKGTDTAGVMLTLKSGTGTSSAHTYT